ncbi:PadR family transcriptional regulator [Pseudonocardia halophobica]|uniref:PadR family transcriptional regulator n=1 Tax=Pseudonocardia halophobica TaxID=29401 RepID=UPI003D92F66D
MKGLSTTSYAILGLLAIRPWTTYELAKQMEVSLRNFWPRAERRLYEEPAKLVDHGLASVVRERVGSRPRSVYRITPAGRDALRAWLAEPGALPSLEFEALVKVFFAEHGGKEVLVANLRRILDGTRERVARDADWADHYLRTGGQFAERLPVISLVGVLQAELNRTVADWARWALDTVDGWPEDLTEAPPARGALERVRRHAEPEGEEGADERAR